MQGIASNDLQIAVSIVLMLVGSVAGATLGLLALVVSSYVVAVIYILIRLTPNVADLLIPLLDIVLTYREATAFSYGIVLLLQIAGFIAFGNILLDFLMSAGLGERHNKTFGLAMGAALGWIFSWLIF